MDAFHSFWSRPGKVINWGEIHFPDYEILTMMLSALKWREYNGPIRMITDTPGAQFFASAGLEGLWDGLSCELDRVPEDIDPYLFWAAGKLWALRSMPCPCVMLDTDLIVWARLEIPPELDAVCAHGEELYPDVYPDPRGFSLRNGSRLPEGWDFTLNAANTAFLYLKDAAFRDYYTGCALSFMREVEGTGLDPTTAMCFAEQRMLPMCAKEKSLRLGRLFDLEQAERQDFVTHVWGSKRALRESEPMRTSFCVQCVRRIVRDYPAWEGVIAGHETLSRYLEGL